MEIDRIKTVRVFRFYFIQHKITAGNLHSVCTFIVLNNELLKLAICNFVCTTLTLTSNVVKILFWIFKITNVAMKQFSDIISDFRQRKFTLVDIMHRSQKLNRIIVKVSPMFLFS